MSSPPSDAGCGRVVLAGGTDLYPQHVGRPLTPRDRHRRARRAPGHRRRPTTVSGSARSPGGPTSPAPRCPRASTGSGPRRARSDRSRCRTPARSAATSATRPPPPTASRRCSRLDASVELTSAAGRRVLPLEAFLTGYRQTALGPDELLTAVLVPRGARGAPLGVPEARPPPLPGDLGRDGGGGRAMDPDDRSRAHGSRWGPARRSPSGCDRSRRSSWAGRSTRSTWPRSPSISPASARSTTSAPRPTTVSTRRRCSCAVRSRSCGDDAVSDRSPST